MHMQKFIFPTLTELVQARKWVEHSYPNLTVVAKPMEFTLSIESLNSTKFDGKISFFMSTYGGKLVEN